MYTKIVNTTKRLMELGLFVAVIAYCMAQTERLVRAEKLVSYLEGVQSVYQEFAEDGTEGTPFTDQGRREQQKRIETHRKNVQGH